jgi:hypothetical protein
MEMEMVEGPVTEKEMELLEMATEKDYLCFHCLRKVKAKARWCLHQGCRRLEACMR